MTIHAADAAVVNRLKRFAVLTRSRGRSPRSKTMPTIMSLPYAAPGPTDTAYPDVSWRVANARKRDDEKRVGVSTRRLAQ